MKEYWFYGTMPNHTIPEEQLTEEQKKIIELEKEKINGENFTQSWIGFKVENGWNFMRHGFEIIYIEEPRGNIAREQLQAVLEGIFQK